jgi:hypothetical protein
MICEKEERQRKPDLYVASLPLGAGKLFHRSHHCFRKFHRTRRAAEVFCANVLDRERVDQISLVNHAIFPSHTKNFVTSQPSSPQSGGGV